MMSGLNMLATGVKNLLFIFNLLFVISGIVLLCFGAVIDGAYSKYNEALDDSFFSLPVFMIIVGVFIVVIAFFGCCGSVKENHCMLMTFCFMLIMIFIFEISAGIAGYVLRNRAGEIIEKRLNETMFNYNISGTNMWDSLQDEFTCCGTKGPSSWEPVHLYGNSSEQLPKTCCRTYGQKDDNSTCTLSSGNRLITNGCEERLRFYVTEHASQLGGLGIGIGIIQLLGVLLSYGLARSIRRNYETV